MIKAKYIAEIDGKPCCECSIQGEPDKIILELQTIIRGICRNPILLGPAISALDDMIVGIDDDIEQLKKENKNND